MAMLPVLDELESEFGERLIIHKIDIDQHLDLAVQQKVMGVPTFVLYKNGRELWRRPGVLTKTALRQIIDELG